MGRLIAAAGIALVLAGCGSAAKPPPGLSLRVDRSPFRLTVLRDGKTVVAEDPGARLRYLLQDNSPHALTKVISSSGNVYRVATDEPGRTATVTVGHTSHGFSIGVQLHPATGVREVFDAFEASPDEHFLGGGERGQTVDLRGQILPVKVSVACSYAPIPFFSSSAGWGLRIASQNVSALAFPGSTGGSGCQSGPESLCSFPPLAELTEVCVQGARLDEDIYVGSLAQTLADYEAVTGHPVVPPRSELELIKWRDEVDGPSQVIEDVTRLQAAKIPIGWVLLDNPWETCNGTLTFDRRLIPDPAALIRRVHGSASSSCSGSPRLPPAPRATRPEARSGRPATACSTCASPQSSPSSGPGCGDSSPWASTASRGTAATRSTCRL